MWAFRHFGHHFRKGPFTHSKLKNAANHRGEPGRDLLEIVLPVLQERQGPVRDQVPGREP